MGMARPGLRELRPSAGRLCTFFGSPDASAASFSSRSRSASICSAQHSFDASDQPGATSCARLPCGRVCYDGSAAYKGLPQPPTSRTTVHAATVSGTYRGAARAQHQRPFVLCLGAVRFAARLKANSNIGDRSEAEALSFSTTVEPSAVVPPWTRLRAACRICTVLHCAQLSAHNCQTSTCFDE